MKPVGCSGFSLLEVLVGGVILVLLLNGVVMMARVSSSSNMASRDLSDGASRLNSFVDSIRGVDAATLVRNAEQIRVAGTDTTRWKIYDNTSGAPYTQSSGSLLLNAKFTWKKTNRVHHVETSTLLAL